MGDFGRVHLRRKTGAEPFRDGNAPLPFDLLSFWQWSVSDLVSNATRGILAEYIVANALGIAARGVRNEWAAFDLRIDGDITVEVKSAAVLQSWHQERIFDIRFRAPQTRAWDAETNILAKEAKRQADVYVFALLGHQDKTTIDPMDVGQWEFYVLPTWKLNQDVHGQCSVSLAALKTMAGESVSFSQLADAVRRAGSRATE